MPHDPVCLIHGAWQGAWVWNRLSPLLEQAGIPVLAADLPGNGADGSDPAAVTLEICLDYLDRLIAPYDHVSVVGHSGGGMIASALAERNKKAVRIAYIAGIVLPAGLGFAEVQARMAGDKGISRGITPYLVWSDDGRVTSVPHSVAQAILFNDCPPQVARTASLALTPQGEGTRSVRLGSDARFTKLPRLYVEATEDMSVPLPLQRHMQRLLPRALVADLPVGHVPHLVAPQLLADHLIPFLTGGRDDEALLLHDDKFHEIL
ncbi:alpha/beta fold hydrolase [Falsirhodobacter sp. alg1]|uniref:alpha/beta fold hydrolase n=1 Tax=Falsirhodobacter sp. alg1 TaxID=1472418 RepID=UPI0007897290|nr:alpha/beta fold hydrolase [Falsirhodobacter sp. alg1]